MPWPPLVSESEYPQIAHHMIRDQQRSRDLEARADSQSGAVTERRGHSLARKMVAVAPQGRAMTAWHRGGAL